MITNEALRVLTNQLAFTKNVNRHYDGSFGVEGAKIGTTLNVRKPVRYIGAEGATLQIEDIVETSVPVVLNHQSHVGITFTSQDLKLSIDEFSKRLIQPAVASIANKIDLYGLQLYQQVYNFAAQSGTTVWTPGTAPATLRTYLDAQAALNNNATPMDGQRHVILSPNMEVAIVDALKGLFQSSNQIREQYEKGLMGIAAGFQWHMDQNTWTHTIGEVGATSAPTMSATAGQTGASLATAGWIASKTVLKTGDIIQIGGVYQVNPQNRQSTGVLQPFVVTADVASASDGTATVTISPSIVTSGAYQTVNAAPAGSAPITLFGQATGTAMNGLSKAATTQGMAFHPDAFTLACADLPLPEGVDMAARASDSDTGLSLRMVRQYDINTDKWPCRLDVLYGWAALRPELACRILA